MAVFAVSFMVKEGARWEERYNALAQAIQDEAVGVYWEETPSFFLLTSPMTSLALKDAIVRRARVNADDTLLVINISETRGHACQGVSDSGRLKHVMDHRPSKQV